MAHFAGYPATKRGPFCSIHFIATICSLSDISRTAKTKMMMTRNTIGVRAPIRMAAPLPLASRRRLLSPVNSWSHIAQLAEVAERTGTVDAPDWVPLVA